MTQTYAPTPVDFLTGDYPSEDTDERTPLEQLADLECRVSALETGASLEPAADVIAIAESETDTYRSELADLEAKHDVVLQLVEEIRGIVKKSTSKVSLDVKAAIDAWANPLATQTPSPAQDEPSPSDERSVSDPDAPSSAAEQPASAGEGLPAHDADVEEWRAYARSAQDAVEGTVIDRLNRSQIRTMLGIEHNTSS